MSLETLLNRPYITIVDLHPVENKSMKEAQKIYFDLLNSPLFDQKNQQWVQGQNLNMEVLDEWRPTSSQLINILLLEQFYGKEKANTQCKKIYKKFYDDDRKWWMYGLNKDLNNIDRRISAEDQLWGVLIKDRLENKEQAKIELKRVNEEFFEKVHGEQEESNISRNNWQIALPHLLKVYVTEQLLGKEEAFIEFKKVKDNFFDKNSRRWTYALDNNLMPASHVFEADTQLMGILLTERLIGKKEAREEFLEVKKDFFDTDHQLFTQSPKLFSGTFYSKDQLLRVWVEKVLEEDEDLIGKSTPLPKIRKY